MADGQAAEYCSDSEDLFGGYDSILEDRSFLVKLDDAEQNERRSNAVDQQHLPTLQPSTDVLTDSITDSLGDFQDLPGSQIQFQEQVHEMMKRSRLEEGGNTSTPVRNWDRTETERQGRARRTDQLKRTMLCNAAAPSHVSRTVALKEAVVCEEISVAMQAIETVSAETTDLGPFFGLPSKVKDLMDKLRGIQSLYGSVDLTHSDVLYKDLSRSLEALLLNSYLHLVYLVTPYDMISQCKPDWMVYYRQFTLLSAAEQRMAAAVGVPESFIARKAAGQTVRKDVDMAVVRCMYLTLVLFSLLKETNLWSVAQRFQLSRGFVQTLLGSSSAFCCCVLHFTEELEELWPFRALLTELTRRLSYCVKPELIPLMEVAGVTESRAKQLYNTGYKTLTHLANADPAVLSRTIENLYRKQAGQIVASAKMLLNEKAAALQEEVDDLLMAPSDLPQLT